MIEKLFEIRHLAIVVAIFMLLNSIASIDTLLFSLVTLIFFLGIIKLFVSNDDSKVNLPEWLISRIGKH